MEWSYQMTDYNLMFLFLGSNVIHPGIILKIQVSGVQVLSLWCGQSSCQRAEFKGDATE